MASLQRTLLAPSPLCCCSYAPHDPRTTRKISQRFSNGTFPTAKPFLRGEFSGSGGALAWRTAGRRRLGVAGAGKGPFFGGGGRRQGSTGRVVGNLAFVALLTYLAVSGQFRWLLDAIVSIWLLTVLLPILGLGALIFFAQRNILQSNCPNCGKSFRILKTSLKDGPQFCPYCTQPFSVQGNEFVRESARFSSGRTATNAQRAFNELFNRGSKGNTPSGSGTVVDIEAEVTDIE
ncbi:uncharacterized protein LOC100822637 isoform X2 [Brachypodium distachyon]|uniref:Uncharacterized protein n=1 Tax=Brachypodium distachyon TaxID=15368 RepID=I1HHW7_BRADI|nr:uncharacterized protein LOC100822637 isoform X2 [Brachypodium distachyon]KQK05529.1 hypothetical protein BRADI_2g20600v3 [Brachypodium distachyon]|eukprot:XP_010231201.1 uncharacterized protein LOC100822637 isoform X2 [Brachypodium distachyon]